MHKKQSLAHKSLMVCVLLALTALCGAQAAQAAPVTFTVNVNLSGAVAVGTSGSLELNFNPGPGDARPATATVTNFSAGGGTLASAVDRFGAVTGTLPGTVIFNSTPLQLNDYFQGIQFGSSLSFNVTLSGPALDAPSGATSGSVFSLLLFKDANGTMPLFASSSNPDGFLLRILINPDGSTSVLRDAPASVLNVTQQAAAVPEPATMILLSTGLAGFAATIRRRRKPSNNDV